MLSQRLARLTGKEIGDACGGCDHTQASRIGSGQRGVTISEWCNLLDAMGLKVVPAEKLCVSKSRFEFMTEMTALALAHKEMARTLFEDPE